MEEPIHKPRPSEEGQLDVFTQYIAVIRTFSEDIPNQVFRSAVAIMGVIILTLSLCFGYTLSRISSLEDNIQTYHNVIISLHGNTQNTIIRKEGE